MSSFKEQMACRQIFHIFSGRFSLCQVVHVYAFSVFGALIVMRWHGMLLSLLEKFKCGFEMAELLLILSFAFAPPNLTNLKNCHFSISILQERKLVSEFDPSAPATLETFSNSSNFTIENCFRGQKWKVRNAKNVVHERSKEEKFFQLRRVQK